MRTVTFSRELAEMVLDMIDAENCSKCGAVLNGENFAGATKDLAFCTNIMCMMEVSKAVKAENELS